MNSSQSFRGAPLTVAALSLLLGCVGQVGRVGDDTTPNGGAGHSGTPGNAGGASGSAGMGASGGGPIGPGGGGMGAPADPLAAGVRPVLLLSAREYLNTVRDLLGDTTLQEGALPPGDEDLQATPSFAFKEPHAVAVQDATLLQGAAEALARSAVAHLTTLLPCATPPAAAETTCLNTFMTTFMPKMYRRPLTATETTRLMALYALGRSTLALGFNDAIGLLIEAGLQSPQFLYHWEVDPGTAVGPAGAVVRLGNYELANRLSYFLWGTMPDTALMAAAAGGQLSSPATVESQVRRMLQDPKASASYLNFFTDFLDLDTLSDTPKDPVTYPMFNAALTAAMATEVQTLVTGIMTSTGRFADLMTGTNSYANQALATFYGIPGVTGTALKPVMLNPAQRAGILTSGAFLALSGDTAESNPPRRGKAIYTKFLCGVMPPPPNGVPKPADASTGGTMRQRMEVHDLNPCAGSCHQIIEPLGFAFEEYGGIGEFRTIDNNAPVNSSGSIVLDGQTHPYNNAPELVKLMAASPTVQSCFATQWLRYAFGRPETPADQASLNAVATALASTGDVRELIVALAKSRTFTYRTATAMELVLK